MSGCVRGLLPTAPAKMLTATMGSQEGIMLTRSEVQRHTSRQSCWVIINNIVYDVTDFIDAHPGGSRVLFNYGGRDATEAFEGLHSPGTLEKYLKPQQVLGGVEILDLGAMGVAEKPPQRKKVRLSSIVSIKDFEIAAKEMLPPRSYAFFRSGAEDEQSYNWNLDSWNAVRLRPRILRPIISVDISTSIFGSKWSTPFLICPAGGGKLAHPKGEVLLAKAAARHDVPQWVCNNAGCTMADMAEARGKGQAQYWQIYPKTDLRESEREIREAIRLGYQGFALTVDAIRAGKRERDLRVGLQDQQNNDAEDDEDEEVDFSNEQTVTRLPVHVEFTWSSAVEWLCAMTDLPVAIKGIQCWEDAAKCLRYENVHPWLSNHGGRQVDASPSSLDTLIAIQRYCPELCVKRDIIVDGGVTRGADIVKALALGARGVGLGRAFLYALVLGEGGVSRAIRILKDEIETTMALVGVSSVAELNPSHVDTSGLEKGVVYLRARL